MNTEKATLRNMNRSTKGGFTFVAVFLLLLQAGCGGGGSGGGVGNGGSGGSGGGGGGQPPGISVSVSPAHASPFLGESQPFSATVAGTSNTALDWSVNGVPGGNATVGIITAGNGETATYTAPSIMPSSPSVTVTAVSAADSSATATATVTIQSDVMVSITPGSAITAPGGTQAFAAVISGKGNPATGLTWSVNGIAGGNSIVGTIFSTDAGAAAYTAPAAPPSPANVSVTTTSVADVSRSATATVTIACSKPNSIIPANATVMFGTMQSFTASLCVLPGTEIIWNVEGIQGGNSVYGTITPSGGDTAAYTAPSAIPPQNPVIIQAISVLAPSQFASASVTITSNIHVTISPATASVALGQRATFTPGVQNSNNAAVRWAVNGAANGDLSVGFICITGSNPCMPPSVEYTGSVDYLAPPVFPPMSPVMVTATSMADPTRSASASATLFSSPLAGLTVTPPYAFLAPQGQPHSTVQFTAALGGGSTAVTWSLSSPSIGQCTSATCGTISAQGFYNAPQLTPSPNVIYVTATSVAQPNLTTTAAVALTSGAVIQTLLPSSATAGIPYGFQLTVVGQNFIAGSGLGASAILINGNSRGAYCPNSTECAITLLSTDVNQPGTLTVQVQNPGTPGPLSNPAPLVLIPFASSKNEISLNSGIPFAAQQDFAVVDPTTAGITPGALTINFAGPLQDNGGDINCTLQQSAITVVPPLSGTEVVSLCVQGNGLDASMTFQFTGPSDINISASNLTGFLENTVELDLTISSGTLPGLRSLFVTTIENDAVVASGLLEVQ
jgi:hypothetical protein